MNRTWWIGCAVWAAVGVARGQEVEEPAGGPVFAEVLARALESGAVARAEGVHCFSLVRHVWRDGGEQQFRWLVRYTVTVDREAEEVVVVSEAQAEGYARGNRFTYHVGFDGDFLGLESAFVHGEVTVEAAGQRLVARRDLRRSRLGDEDVYEDTERVLPKIVGVFVLPQWFDQGLPERHLFQDVTPFGQVTGPLRLRRLEGEEADGLEGCVTYGTDEGYSRPTTLVDVVAEGEDVGLLRRFRTRSYRQVEGEERLVAEWVNERIEPAEYARLEAELFPAEDEEEPSDE